MEAGLREDSKKIAENATAISELSQRTTVSFRQKGLARELCVLAGIEDELNLAQAVKHPVSK